MSEQVSSETLYIVRRAIEFILAFVACVALHALSPNPFYAGWFGGALFAIVYCQPWSQRK